MSQTASSIWTDPEESLINISETRLRKNCVAEYWDGRETFNFIIYKPVLFEFCAR